MFRVELLFLPFLNVWLFFNLYVRLLIVINLSYAEIDNLFPCIFYIPDFDYYLVSCFFLICISNSWFEFFPCWYILIVCFYFFFCMPELHWNVYASFRSIYYWKCWRIVIFVFILFTLFKHLIPFIWVNLILMKIRLILLLGLI